MSNMANLEWVSNGSAYDYHLMRTFIRARPQATEKHTVEALEKMGLFGYYKVKEKS